MSDIFVFGSNLAGRHGKGAALYARKHHGAIYGQGYGLQGNSFAIPTKDHDLRTYELCTITLYVETFKQFARQHSGLKFLLTPIGCGLAGYKHNQIGPLFNGCSSNVVIPSEFHPFVNEICDINTGKHDDNSGRHAANLLCKSFFANEEPTNSRS